MKKSIFLTAIILVFCSCQKRMISLNNERIKGLSVVGSPNAIADTSFNAMQRIGANFVCLIPYAFTPKNSPRVITNSNYQWWGETKQGIIACRKMADSLGLKVMIKPQIWLSGGEYTGNLTFNTATDWNKWHQEYFRYTVKFAELADSLNVEVFCIGTELGSSVTQNPKFWNDLIDSTRNIYKGTLTYAANWDDYQNVPFWSQLDYIGIDAYFPLCEQNCDEKTLIKNWHKISSDMEHFAKKLNKQILFTEFGYPSAHYALVTPWVTSKSALEESTQKLAYDVFFKEVWGQPWLAGIFVWKWYPEPNQHRLAPNDFTPQGKAALKSLKRGFKP